MKNYLPVKRQNLANYLIYSVVACTLISIFLVYNASSTYAFNHFGNSFYFLINQSVWVLFSFIMFFLIQKVPFSLIQKAVFPLFIFAVLVLVFVLFPTDFSLKVYGARRWLLLNPHPLPEIPFLGRVSFQPSEFTKLVICLLIPKIFLSTPRFKEGLGVVSKCLVYFLVPAFLILIEPDLKDALILSVIGFSILFAGGVDIKFFLGLIPISLVLLMLLIFTSSYRLERLKTYLGGGSSETSSYHVRQINIALGSGGLFGVGVGKSVQKNEYLPEVVGDSIFAVFGEEFGFVGSLFLTSLLFFVLFCLYKATLYIQSDYKKLVAVGVFTWFGCQVLLNLGSISGLIPLTGVPLPLISYGGSSLIFMVSGIGLVYRFILQD